MITETITWLQSDEKGECHRLAQLLTSLIEMVTLHFSDQINYLRKGQKLMSISSLTLNLPSYLLVGMIVFLVLPMLKSISCWNSTFKSLVPEGEWLFVA